VKYFRAKQLAQDLNISVSTVWRWVHTGMLPKPIKLTSRTTVWRADEVEAAIEKHSGAINDSSK
jgi:predicted DNA-binding transcriptional regulator AlpA